MMLSTLQIVLLCAFSALAVGAGIERHEICPEYVHVYCACSADDIAEVTSVKMCPLFPKSPDFVCLPCPISLQDRINCSKCSEEKCPICSLENIFQGGYRENKQYGRKNEFIKFMRKEPLSHQQNLTQKVTTDASYPQLHTLLSSEVKEDIESSEDIRNNLHQGLKVEDDDAEFLLTQQQYLPKEASSGKNLESEGLKSRFKGHVLIVEPNTSRRNKINQPEFTLNKDYLPTTVRIIFKDVPEKGKKINEHQRSDNISKRNHWFINVLDSFGDNLLSLSNNIKTFRMQELNPNANNEESNRIPERKYQNVFGTLKTHSSLPELFEARKVLSIGRKTNFPEDNVLDSGNSEIVKTIQYIKDNFNSLNHQEISSRVKRNLPNLMAEDIFALRNSGSSQPDNAGAAAGNSETFRVGDSFGFSNSGDSILKEKYVEGNAGMSQGSDSIFVGNDSSKENFTEDAVEMRNARTSSTEGIVKGTNVGTSSVEDIAEMRNSRTSGADSIGEVDKSENFTTENAFASGVSEDLSLKESDVNINETAAQFQKNADSKFVTDSSGNGNSRRPSADDILEMRNLQTSQEHNVGNSENSTAEHSFFSGNSENSSFKQTDVNANVNVAMSQEDNSKFVTGFGDKNVPEKEAIEMSKSGTFQADAIGLLDDSENSTADNAFASSNSENRPLEERDVNVGDNVGKFQQNSESRIVTDSSSKRNLINSSEEDILEMRNSTDSSAKDNLEMRNSRTSQVEDKHEMRNSSQAEDKLEMRNSGTSQVEDNLEMRNSRTSQAEDKLEMRNSRISQVKDNLEMRNSETSPADSFVVVDKSEHFTAEVPVSSIPRASGEKDVHTKENAKDGDAKNASRKTRRGNHARNHSKNVSMKNLEMLVEEGHGIHNGTTEFDSLPTLRRLFHYASKEEKGVIHFSVNDDDLKSRSKRSTHSIPHNDWCTINRGAKHGNMDCTMWTYKKECKLCCHKGYTFNGKTTAHFKCDRKTNSWEPKMCPCKPDHGNDPPRPPERADYPFFDDDDGHDDYDGPNDYDADHGFDEGEYEEYDEGSDDEYYFDGEKK